MGLPDWQHIEDAFKAPAEVIGKLPESTESKRATDHLKLAESYTMQARERAKADRTEAVSGPTDASVALTTGGRIPTTVVHTIVDGVPVDCKGHVYLVGDSGPEFITTARPLYVPGPTVSGWPWRMQITDDVRKEP